MISMPSDVNTVLKEEVNLASRSWIKKRIGNALASPPCVSRTSCISQAMFGLRLLCHPCRSWVCCATGKMNASTPQLDEEEEEDVKGFQPGSFHWGVPVLGATSAEYQA